MPLVSIGEHRLFYQEVGPTVNSGAPGGDPSTALRVTQLADSRHGAQAKTNPPCKNDNDDRSPIIFLHGFTLDHRQWLKQAAYFGRSRRVISIDAMGHGKSDAPESGYSRADRVEHLHAFVEALKIERFHLVGLSMGGTTAIGYALKFGQQLESLTLVSTAAAGWRASNKVSMVDRLARKKGLEVARRKWKQITLAYYKAEHQIIKQLMETMIDGFSGAIWLDPMRGKYPREYDLEKVRQIETPTLIMAGERDRIFVPLAHMLHEQIPESRLLVYENVGHMLNMEQPERFNADLDGFLNQIETPA